VIIRDFRLTLRRKERKENQLLRGKSGVCWLKMSFNRYLDFPWMYNPNEEVFRMLKKALLPLVILTVLILPLTAFATEGSQSQEKTLSLADCLKIGYANSQGLKLAAKNVNVAQEGVKQAAGSFWPTLNYSLGYDKANAGSVTYVQKNTTTWNEWEAINIADHSYSGALSLSMPLYSGGKLTSSLKVALLKLASAKEDERTAKQKLTYDIKAAFYTLWLAEQELKVAQTSYDNLQQHYEQVEKAYKVGNKSKYELLKAEVAWKKEKPTVIVAENTVIIAKLNLATLIGMGKEQELEISYDDSLLQVPDQIGQTFQPLLEEAYKQRPEIHQAVQNTQIAKLNTAIAKAGYKPTLSLDGTYESTGTTTATSDWDESWTLAVGLSGLLFDGPTTLSKIKEAKTNEQIAAITDTKTRDEIRQAVQTALQGLKEDLASVISNQANIELAKESLRMTEARFEAGMATTLDVKDSQLSLDEASDGYYEGVSAYFTALAKLDYVLGRD
jgi:outer membrane protein